MANNYLQFSEAIENTTKEEKDKPTNLEVVWYASGGGFTRSGPFVSQVEAWRSCELTDELQRKTGRVHPSDAKVWPERAGRKQK